MSEWTEKDEEKLVEYEDELNYQASIAKNSGFIVAGVYGLIVMGLLIILIVKII